MTDKQEQGEPKKKWKGQIDNDEFFESLEQEQGEPVAQCCSAGIAHDCHAGDGCRIVERIKSTPQPAQKPLTDEQIEGIAQMTCIGISPHEDTLNFARAIEAAHGIKDNK